MDYWPSRRRRPFEPEDFDELICASMASTGPLCFVCIAPFTKQMRRQYAAIGAAAAQSEAQSVIGYFPPTPETIRQHLRLLRVASHEDLVLGACRERFQDIPQGRPLTPVVEWNLEFLLTQPNNVCCAALYSSETGIVRILTHVYSAVDDLLNNLDARRRKQVAR